MHKICTQRAARQQSAYNRSAASHLSPSHAHSVLLVSPKLSVLRLSEMSFVCVCVVGFLEYTYLCRENAQNVLTASFAEEVSTTTYALLTINVPQRAISHHTRLCAFALLGEFSLTVRASKCASVIRFRSLCDCTYICRTTTRTTTPTTAFFT